MKALAVDAGAASCLWAAVVEAVGTGVLEARMDLELVNERPVTLILEL